MKKETVDELPYVGWQEEKKDEAVVLSKTRKEYLQDAKAAQEEQKLDGSRKFPVIFTIPLICVL